MSQETRPPQPFGGNSDDGSYRLLVIDGDRSFVFRLPEQGVVQVGRDVGPGGLTLKEPSVSRLHCQIKVRGSEMLIDDCVSTFGTCVNGEEVQAQRVLAVGDQIHLREECNVRLLVMGPSGSAPSRLHPQVREGMDKPEVFQKRLREELARSIERQRPLALVHFKWDEDYSPVQMVTLLSSHLRVSDRLGEAGARSLRLLLPEIDEPHAMRKARRLLGRLGTAVPSIRGGLASCPYDELSVGELEQIAEEAANQCQPGMVAGLDSLVVVKTFGRLRWITCGGPTDYVLKQIDLVAPYEQATLINGETGTGKELVAAALHARSGRAGKAFLPVNCGAIASSLAESELFGHKKGAFSGAIKDHVGYFEQASGGTLFLDEVADLPKDLQVKLVRVLESKELTPVGGEKARTVDVRVVAATHADFAKIIAASVFREDLYYRLSGSIITLLPLRDRRREILVLAKYFVSQFCQTHHRSPPRFSCGAAYLLQQYPWPGNVRELKNKIENAVIQCPADEPEILVGHLARELRQGKASPVGGGVNVGGGALPSEEAPRVMRPFDELVLDFERRIIVAALRDAQGVKKRAAELLGMPLRSFWHKYRQHRDSIRSLLQVE